MSIVHLLAALEAEGKGIFILWQFASLNKKTKSIKINESENFESVRQGFKPREAIILSARKYLIQCMVHPLLFNSIFGMTCYFFTFVPSYTLQWPDVKSVMICHSCQNASVELKDWLMILKNSWQPWKPLI